MDATTISLKACLVLKFVRYFQLFSYSLVLMLRQFYFYLLVPCLMHLLVFRRTQNWNVLSISLFWNSYSVGWQLHHHQCAKMLVTIYFMLILKHPLRRSQNGVLLDSFSNLCFGSYWPLYQLDSQMDWHTGQNSQWYTKSASLLFHRSLCSLLSDSIGVQLFQGREHCSRPGH